MSNVVYYKPNGVEEYRILIDSVYVCRSYKYFFEYYKFFLEEERNRASIHRFEDILLEIEKVKQNLVRIDDQISVYHQKNERDR